MMDWLTPLYPWTKAFHIVAVIAWMAGMLYLPRLFVYHCDAAPGTPASEMLKVMERRLLRAIINPAMIATVLFGAALVATPGVVDWSQGWFPAKLALVVAMTGVHGLLARWRKDFEADRNRRPARFYRIVNEVPTILMIAIVILAVVKPF
jgi:putative membrane protein